MKYAFQTKYNASIVRLGDVRINITPSISPEFCLPEKLVRIAHHQAGSFDILTGYRVFKVHTCFGTYINALIQRKITYSNFKTNLSTFKGLH